MYVILLQLNSSSGVAHFVQKMLLFSLSTDKVVYDHNITVTWAIPDDEATHKDWIGQFEFENTVQWKTFEGESFLHEIWACHTHAPTCMIGYSILRKFSP